MCSNKQLMPRARARLPLPGWRIIAAQPIQTCSYAWLPPCLLVLWQAIAAVLRRGTSGWRRHKHSVLLTAVLVPVLCLPARAALTCVLRVVCVLAVAALSAEVPPNTLSHVIITHVGPNRIPTLKLLLEAALQGRPAGQPLKLVATNPAQVALEKSLTGEQQHGQANLRNVDLQLLRR